VAEVAMVVPRAALAKRRALGPRARMSTTL
jgi:hypothetical protein